jgi:hypothetical protein
MAPGFTTFTSPRTLTSSRSASAILDTSDVGSPAGGAQLHRVGEVVLVVRAGDHRLPAGHLGEALQHVPDLAGAHEHPLHLDAVAHPAEQPGQLGGGAAAGAGPAGGDHGEVAGGEAQQRIGLVEDRRHHLAGLARRGGLAGLQIQHLHDGLGVQVPAAFLRALVGQAAEVGGAVALQHPHAEAGLQVGAQRLGEHLGHHVGHLDGERRPGLAGLAEERVQEAGRAQVGGGAQVVGHLHLKLGLAHPGGDDGAAQGPGGAVEHEAERGQVVAGGVVDDLAGAESGGGQGVSEAPEVGRVALGVVDGAGRHEDAGQPARGDAVEAAEGRLLGLQPRQRVLAQHRDLAQVLERGDVPWPEAGLPQDVAHPGGVLEGGGHGPLQARRKVAAADLRALALDGRVEHPARAQRRHGASSDPGRRAV